MERDAVAAATPLLAVAAAVLVNLARPAHPVAPRAHITLHNEGATTIVVDRVRVASSQLELHARLAPGETREVVLEHAYAPPPCRAICDAPPVAAVWHDARRHSCEWAGWADCAIGWSVGSHDVRGYAGNIEVDLILR